MKEPYIEGLATHGDPESCVGVREDAGEALTGARAGRAIEPRNQLHSGCRRRSRVGRQHRRQRYRELPADPARSENLHARNLHAREPGDPVLARPVDHRAGRSGKAKAAILR